MHNKDKFRKREEQSEILEEIEEVAANVKLQRWIGFVRRIEIVQIPNIFVGAIK